MPRPAPLAPALPSVAPVERRRLQSRLLRWYHRCARDLPWRRTRDPYQVWVSEVMLQQTQVRTVEPYFQRFLAAFPSVQRLAESSLDQVLLAWQGLGYYARARNLHETAKILCRTRPVRWPTDAAAWQALPGVGRYTAAAIASIAFDQPVAALDGNIRRVLARLAAMREPADAPAVQARLWRLAEDLLATASPGDFNQALMELGARVCTPRAPDCRACPVLNHCRAARAGLQQAIPVRRPRRAAPQVSALAAAIRHDGRYLLLRRGPRGLLAGLWGLPTVETPGPCDDPAAALRQAVRPLTGLRVRSPRLLGTVSHVFTHRKLTLTVVEWTLADRAPALSAAAPAAAWLAPAEFATRPLSELDRKALTLLGGEARDALQRRAAPGAAVLA
jgi:A/G-specific adenine glycosylase